MMTKSRVLGLVVTVLLPLTALSATSAPAMADHRDNANSGHLNTRTWRICTYIPGQGQSAVDAGVSRINATAVNATQTCSNSNYSMNVEQYPDTWLGLTLCTGTQTGSVCTFKTTYVNLRTSTTAQERRTSATHELGHGAGLGHRCFTLTTAMGCDSSPPMSEFFDNHDVQAIGNTYP